ncbi:UNVERIFIED_CONTAM: hypothetical protein K2H54_016942 [Gekko kuhli]
MHGKPGSKLTPVETSLAGWIGFKGIPKILIQYLLSHIHSWVRLQCRSMEFTPTPDLQPLPKGFTHQTPSYMSTVTWDQREDFTRMRKKAPSIVLKHPLSRSQVPNGKGSQ